MDKMRALELFIATCDGGTFAEAARRCNTDPSTVSKAIARLESELGLTLFQRSTRQLRITPAGQNYALTIRKMLLELSDCEQSLKSVNDSPSGTLKISCAVCYAHLYLKPLLKAFTLKHPDIQFELEVSDLHVDVIENNIDIAIRTGYIKDSRLVARRLSPMDFFTCASPQYLQKYGTPQHADEFSDQQWIGFRIKQSQLLQPIFLPNNTGEYRAMERTRNHVTDDGEMMAAMCADGLGVAQLPHFLAKQGLDSGDLVSLYPHYRPPQADSGVFVIYPKRDFLPIKVRTFIDFMVAWLETEGEGANHTWADKISPLVRFT